MNTCRACELLNTYAIGAERENRLPPVGVQKKTPAQRSQRAAQSRLPDDIRVNLRRLHVSCLSNSLGFGITASLEKFAAFAFSLPAPQNAVAPAARHIQHWIRPRYFIDNPESSSILLHGGL